METRSLTAEERESFAPVFAYVGADEPVRVVDTKLGKEYDVFVFTRDGQTLLVKKVNPKRRELAIFREYFAGRHFAVPVILDEMTVGEERWLLLPYIDGPDARGCTPTDAAKIAGALAEIQSAYFGRDGQMGELKKYFAWVQSGCDGLRSYFPELDAVWERARARFFSAPRTLVHDDLLPINVLLSGNGPVIIDWETAGIYPYFLDLARFALVIHDGTPYVSREAADAFFAAYYRAMRRNPAFAISEEQYAIDVALSTLVQYLSFVDTRLPVEEMRETEDGRILLDVVRFLSDKLL